MSHWTSDSSLFPLSRYYFHRRQEANLSQPIISLPAPYQATAGSFHSNTSLDLYMWAWEMRISVHDVRIRADLEPKRNELYEDMRIQFHRQFPPAVAHWLISVCNRLRWGVEPTHLPSWLLSMMSNCFLSHLHREDRGQTAMLYLTQKVTRLCVCRWLIFSNQYKNSFQSINHSSGVYKSPESFRAVSALL